MYLKTNVNYNKLNYCFVFMKKLYYTKQKVSKLSYECI